MRREENAEPIGVSPTLYDKEFLQMSVPVSRRRFFQMSSGAALGMAAAGVSSARAAAFVSPNSKITLGIIGVGGRGMNHVGDFKGQPDVQIVAICDVYQPHLDAALAQVGSGATGYSDFRKLLERKDLDAVVVATPPHWHPLITIAACEAGKDVYCEKPMTMFPGEIAPVLRAARENKRITQVGTQIHATPNYHRVVEIVRSGILGKITAARNILFLQEPLQGDPKPVPPPKDLDWEMWLGPAPEQPFSWAKFQGGQHRYFKALIGSWLHEMGPHIVDLPVWALELGAPKSAAAGGGRFANLDAGDVPDALDVTWEYPGLIMTWHHSAANAYPFQWTQDGGNRHLAVLFQGTKGSLAADYDRYELLGDAKGAKLPEPSLPVPASHAREWLDAIKTRKPPSCNVEYHANVHKALNLGQLAHRVGRKVYWDDAKGQVIGDREADRAATPQYRKPWSLPSG
jgi:predicted dehydrogenase